MRSVLVAILTTLSLNSFAADPQAVCHTWLDGKPTGEMTYLGTVETDGPSLVSGDEDRFQKDDVVVETSSGSGCSMSCWVTRNIRVIVNGVSMETSDTYSTEETNSTRERNDRLMYPSMKVKTAIGTLSISCSAKE